MCTAIFTSISEQPCSWFAINKSGRVFPRRLTNGGIFNNRLSFENNRLLFSLLFSRNFLGERQGLDGGDKVVMGDPPVPPH